MLPTSRFAPALAAAADTLHGLQSVRKTGAAAAVTPPDRIVDSGDGAGRVLHVDGPEEAATRGWERLTLGRRSRRG